MEATANLTPIRWWQWALKYPAMIVALIGAVPTYLDLTESLSTGTRLSVVYDRKAQSNLWEANFECVSQPRFDGQTTSNNVEVAATVCPSGDVLLRVKAPNAKELYRWVPLNSVQSASRGWASLLVGEAFAADVPGRFAVAQSGPMVICQKRLQGGLILRRVSYPQGCFDEVIDTRTGALIQRTPAKCETRC